MGESRLRLAIQKSGRLTERSLELLAQCGLKFNWSKSRLLSNCENYPLDLILVRDDDIPEYVNEGTCDLGFVGENVLREKSLKEGLSCQVIQHLEFGKCRLSIALPTETDYQSLSSLEGKKIATSYPHSLKAFLAQQEINAHVIEITGSVEIAPAVGIAEAICDLVSTGSTLKSNGLKEVHTLLKSESVCIQTPQELSEKKQLSIKKILSRIQGVKTAEATKYVMMNAPRSALDEIRAVLPGMEHPSVMQLDGDPGRIAIHAVCREDVFWETMERLKNAGATSVLVLPIEKII